MHHKRLEYFLNKQFPEYHFCACFRHCCQCLFFLRTVYSKFDSDFFFSQPRRFMVNIAVGKICKKCIFNLLNLVPRLQNNCFIPLWLCFHIRSAGCSTKKHLHPVLYFETLQPHKLHHCTHTHTRTLTHRSSEMQPQQQPKQRWKKNPTYEIFGQYFSYINTWNAQIHTHRHT